MKKAKKFLSVFFCLTILLTALLTGFTASAEELTEGFYKYSIYDGEACITDVDTSISGDVVIPSTLGGYKVVYIGESAFEGCINVDKITVPDTVEVIYPWAFLNCKNLKEIKLGKNVRSIGYYAFEDCSSIKEITVPENVEFFDIQACGFCDSLETINILGKNTRMSSKTYPYLVYDSAFPGCNNLKAININSENIYYCFDNGVLFSKDKSQLIWYSPYKTDSSYTVPDGVKNIENYSFEGNNHIETVAIANSVEKIGCSAFENCSRLKNIQIGKNIKAVEDNAFEGTAFFNDENNWDDGYLYLDNVLLFYNYEAGRDRDIVIRDGTKIIADYALYHPFVSTGVYVESVSIPDSVTIIGDYAFDGFSNVKNLKLPSNLVYIGDFAFNYWNGISQLEIPNSVEEIGELAFNQCTNLSEITLGENIKKIQWNSLLGTAFYDNPSNWDGDVLYIGKYLIDAKDSISGKYSIKEGTEIIAVSAFWYCNNLTEIVIPESIRVISDGALGGCHNLKTVYLPKSIKLIETLAFADCFALKYIRYSGTESMKADIEIQPYNEEFENAEWIYGESASLLNGFVSHVDYRATQTFTVTLSDGAKAEWYVNNQLVNSGSSCTVNEAKYDYEIRVLVTDAEGNGFVDEAKITVKNSFFNKLIAFFKGLFGLLPVYVDGYKT